MPKDVECAFMVEAFKGISELIHTKYPSFNPPLNNYGDPVLKPTLLFVIDKFGTDIFAEELSRNRDRLATILGDSRNRIAHIKSKQSQRYLDGGESVMYLMKLSLLYRVVLLDLLGIPQNAYKTALLSRVQTVNNHETMKSFLNSL